MDEKALNYVYEENLKALPTMSTVLAYPGFWLKEPDTGVDWTKVLHADQEIILHKPLPPSGTVKATTKVKVKVSLFTLLAQLARKTASLFAH